jgi:hypothetical protein
MQLKHQHGHQLPVGRRPEDEGQNQHRRRRRRVTHQSAETWYYAVGAKFKFEKTTQIIRILKIMRSTQIIRILKIMRSTQIIRILNNFPVNSQLTKL